MAKQCCQKLRLRPAEAHGLLVKALLHAAKALQHMQPQRACLAWLRLILAGTQPNGGKFENKRKCTDRAVCFAPILQIAKSPLSASVAVDYVITSGGVQQAPSMDGQAAMAVAPHSALNVPIANPAPGQGSGYQRTRR
jgi:hypothetical protein